MVVGFCPTTDEFIYLQFQEKSAGELVIYISIRHSWAIPSLLSGDGNTMSAPHVCQQHWAVIWKHSMEATTRQVRVVRFYVSLPASFLHLLPPPSSAGPQLQTLDRSVPPLDQSVPCRTSTASSGSKCSLQDLNHKESRKIYQIECQKECQKICQIHMPERLS